MEDVTFCGWKLERGRGLMPQSSVSLITRALGSEPFRAPTFHHELDIDILPVIGDSRLNAPSFLIPILSGRF